MWPVYGDLDPDELTGQQLAGGVLELGAHLPGTEARIDLAGGEVDPSPRGVAAAVAEDQAHFGVGSQAAARKLGDIRFGQCKTRPHRMDLADAGEQAVGGGDQASFGTLRPAADSRQRRGDAGVGEIEFRFTHAVLGDLDRGLGQFQVGDCVVVLALADGLLLGQFLEAARFPARLLIARTFLRELRLHLRHSDLEGRRIDLEQRRACLYELAFAVEPFEHNAGDACAHFDFPRTFDLADRFQPDRDPLRRKLRHACGHRPPRPGNGGARFAFGPFRACLGACRLAGGFGRGCLAAACGEEQYCTQDRGRHTN